MANTQGSSGGVASSARRLSLLGVTYCYPDFGHGADATIRGRPPRRRVRVRSSEGSGAAFGAYWTTSDIVALALEPPLVQRTVTGQLPGVVREPTVQLQEMVPLALAFFGPRPAALEGPDLY
jgi:hypothetical protein